MADEKNKVEYNCTRVTPSMVISGDVTSTDTMLVEGQIYGNVDTSSNLTAKNLIVGNVNADNAALDSGRVKGDIKLNGTLAINNSSIVVGDVKVRSLKLDGKVHGNVNVDESALITESALLVGNIAAQYVATQTGARINGSIITTGPKSSVNIDEEFDLGDITNHAKGGKL